MNFFPKEKKIYREGIIFSDLQSNQNLKQIVSSHELIHIDQRLLSTFHKKKKNNPKGCPNTRQLNKGHILIFIVK